MLTQSRLDGGGWYATGDVGVPDGPPEVVEEFERTASGKIKKLVLREALRA